MHQFGAAIAYSRQAQSWRALQDVLLQEKRLVKIVPILQRLPHSLRRDRLYLIGLLFSRQNPYCKRRRVEFFYRDA